MSAHPRRDDEGGLGRDRACLISSISRSILCEDLNAEKNASSGCVLELERALGTYWRGCSNGCPMRALAASRSTKFEVIATPDGCFEHLSDAAMLYREI
jgi:hypothetical protein